MIRKRRIPAFLAGAATAVLAGRCATSPPPRPPTIRTLEQAPSRFASFGGYRVHYKSLGRGREALVFIHGWTCDLDFWRFQIPAFAARSRVLALDLPGHGLSDKPDLVYSMALFAQAVEVVLRDAGVDRAVLVGHSLGTPVAREFYRLFPRKTLALVAVDGSLRPLITDPEAVAKFLAPYRGPGYKEALGRMIDTMLTASTPADARERIRRTMLSTPQHVVVSAGEGMFDPEIWKEDSIGVPVLTVLARSPFWRPDYEAFVRRLAPRSEFRVLEGVGHFLMIEKPQEFNAILLRFLTDQGLLKP